MAFTLKKQLRFEVIVYTINLASQANRWHNRKKKRSARRSNCIETHQRYDSEHSAADAVIEAEDRERN
jgi:hypothetical protein